MSPPANRDFPSELRSRAERVYAKALRDTLAGESVFPLPFSFPPPQLKGPLASLQSWLACVKAAEKTPNRPAGLTVERVSRDCGPNGIGQIPENLRFEAAADLAAFCGRQAEWAAALRAVQTLASAFPHLDSRRVALALKFAAVPAGILDAAIILARYLVLHPFPGCHARELPLPLPTKFIEENETLLRELLRAAHPEVCRPDPADPKIETLLGLAKPRPLLRGRFAADARPASLPDSPAAFTPEGWAEMNFAAIDAVFVVENQVTFLTFPLPPRALAFWGEGRGVAHLAPVLPALAARPLYYWGDLDTHGFEILADLRRLHPDTQSFLMEAELLERFDPYVGRGPTTSTHPERVTPYLTRDEAALYRRLRETCHRLEQERIPQTEVAARLAGLPPRLG